MCGRLKFDIWAIFAGKYISMKKQLTPILLIAGLSLLAQVPTQKLYHFECFGNNTSIPLPPDFLGPKYFPYEGGSIIDFYADKDTCVVSMLCGESGELKLDETYKTLAPQAGKASIYYYSATKNKYARKLNLNEYQLMYDHANATRKAELDVIFDLMEGK